MPSSRRTSPSYDDEEEEGYSNPDTTNFEDDFEQGAGSPPARSVSFRRNKESPGIKTVGTDDTANMTITHVNRNSRVAPVLCMGMTKPALCLVLILLLLTVGGGLFGWLTIPGLNQQIKDLEKQVDRLEGQVDRLETEVDRFEELNGELNASIAELNAINENLNATVFRLEGEVDRMEILNDQLAFENDRYSRLNDELNETADQLGAEVDELELQVDELEITNSALTNLTNSLRNETDRLGLEIDDLETQVSNLEEETDRLSDEVDNLNSTVANLARENNRLRELNANLETIVGFLNETTGEITETLEEVTKVLADQIEASRLLLMQNQENIYRDSQHGWRCTYHVYFTNRPFGNNPNISIGRENVAEVLQYVEEQILSSFCVDPEDFESFLSTQYGLDSMTSGELFQGVLFYTDEVLQYYYPPEGGSGLSTEDWAEADFKCENLSQQFKMGGVV